MSLLKKINSCFVHLIVLKLCDLVIKDTLSSTYIFYLFLLFLDLFASSKSAFSVTDNLLLGPFFQFCYLFLLLRNHKLKFLYLLSQAEFHSLDFNPFFVLKVFLVMRVKDIRLIPIFRKYYRLLSVQLSKQLYQRYSIKLYFCLKILK